MVVASWLLSGENQVRIPSFSTIRARVKKSSVRPSVRPTSITGKRKRGGEEKKRTKETIRARVKKSSVRPTGKRKRDKEAERKRNAPKME